MLSNKHATKLQRLQFLGKPSNLTGESRSQPQVLEQRPQTLPQSPRNPPIARNRYRKVREIRPSHAIAAAKSAKSAHRPQSLPQSPQSPPIARNRYRKVRKTRPSPTITAAKSAKNRPPHGNATAKSAKTRPSPTITTALLVCLSFVQYQLTTLFEL